MVARVFFFFSFLFFSAHHSPPPLENYSKGQSKSEQAAIRKPIYLMWFMDYCTDWSVVCQALLVFLQVEVANHNRILSPWENHANNFLKYRSLEMFFKWSHHPQSCSRSENLCIASSPMLYKHHTSCNIWLCYCLLSCFSFNTHREILLLLASSIQ